MNILSLQDLAFEEIFKYHIHQCVELARILIKRDEYPVRVCYTHKNGLNKGELWTIKHEDKTLKVLEIAPGYLTAPTFFKRPKPTFESIVKYEVNVLLGDFGSSFIGNDEEIGQGLFKWPAVSLDIELRAYGTEFYLTDLASSELHENNSELNVYDYNKRFVRLYERLSFTQTFRKLTEWEKHKWMIAEF